MQMDPNSAKIYHFPLNPRATLTRRQMIVSSAAMRAAEAPTVGFGGGWYHDAAIEEEAQERETAREAAEKVRPLFRH